MDIHHLVTMANQIGNFHRSFPDHAEAVKGTAMHIRRGWEPRMRRQLLAHIDATGGKDLEPIVMEAIEAYRKELTPPPVVPVAG
ncbi:MAG TPA: formate dehydrogenase subunit delta [Gemmatimonadales bacterium]|nr:formate dehydrogenase subunit delta [Gemmatimonadales bacterium]